MAVRAKAKVKSRRLKEIQELTSPEAQKRAERRVKKQLGEMDDRADERYEYAMKLLKGQSNETLDAVELMIETMSAMAGAPRFIVDGAAVNVEPEILATIQRKLHTWAAVRLLVACAKWDIRIAGFQPPKGICPDCGKAVW